MDKADRVNPTKAVEMITDTFDAADGCRLRWGMWRASGGCRRGTVLLLHGRTEYLEKYAEAAGDLNRRGFDALSFDWRGQGRSCRLLPDPAKGHVDDYEDYLQDLQQLLIQAAPRLEAPPVGVVAHSMGGHIALRHLHDRPGSIHWALLLSPMIDLCWGPIVDVCMRGLTRVAIRLGEGNACVPSGGRADRPDGGFDGNFLTGDRKRFFRERRRVAENPDLAVDGVTFGWLSATFRSIDVLKRAGYPEKIQTPVGIVGAGADRIVSVSAQRRI
jgi:lysophospholipase